MFGYDHTEKILREYIFQHSKDFGRFTTEIMLYSPKLMSDYMQGMLDATIDYYKGTKPKLGFKHPN